MLLMKRCFVHLQKLKLKRYLSNMLKQYLSNMLKQYLLNMLKQYLSNMLKQYLLNMLKQYLSNMLKQCRRSSGLMLNTLHNNRPSYRHPPVLKMMVLPATRLSAFKLFGGICNFCFPILQTNSKGLALCLCGGAVFLVVFGVGINFFLFVFGSLNGDNDDDDDGR
ncbi:hypothetical protein GPALN_014756 [Globodera pallida]|nr:hypothetical protein GPALN_014756 [Globodera pallida]